MELLKYYWFTVYFCERLFCKPAVLPLPWPSLFTNQSPSFVLTIFYFFFAPVSVVSALCTRSPRWQLWSSTIFYCWSHILTVSSFPSSPWLLLSFLSFVHPTLHLSSDLYKSLQSGSQAALPPHLQLAFSGNLHPSTSSPSVCVRLTCRSLLCYLLVLQLSVCCSVSGVQHASGLIVA